MGAEALIGDRIQQRGVAAVAQCVAHAQQERRLGGLQGGTKALSWGWGLHFDSGGIGYNLQTQPDGIAAPKVGTRNHDDQRPWFQLHPRKNHVDGTTQPACQAKI
jgi:hypothetical protein